MNYRLAVLSHGPDGEQMVDRALAAFGEHVTPWPEAVTVHYDRPQQGFCKATAELWRQMTGCGNEYVFWLEHDFLICHHVDLRDLAAVLDAYRPRLAQMALMRDAYSQEEKDAGGLFQYRRGDFDNRRFQVYDDDFDIGDGNGALRTEHRWMTMPWWTSNPHLARRDFMEDHPFVADEPNCEGKHGIKLARDYDLMGKTIECGTWGSGEVWCNHVGVRDGSGHGY